MLMIQQGNYQTFIVSLTMKDKTMFTRFVRKLLSENYSRHIRKLSILNESGENR